MFTLLQLEIKITDMVRNNGNKLINRLDIIKKEIYLQVVNTAIDKNCHKLIE